MNLRKRLRKVPKLNTELPHTLSVFLLFCILFSIFFSPVIGSQYLLAPGDGLVYYVPAFYAARTLWTDLLLSGFPVAADPQIQTWYPISLLFSLIPNAWNAYVISAYVLASCFTYGYVFSLTNSRWAAFFSGIVYSMSGFMMAHLGHTTIIHAAAWIPLLIWAADRLRQRLTPLWFLVGACGFSCITLAGHPQISLYAMGLSTAYALVLGWTAPVGRWKYYGIYISVLVLGVCLAALQILPTAELAGLGLRTEMTFEAFVSFSLPLGQITQLLFPFLFGGGGTFQTFGEPPYFGEWNLTEITGYVGIVPLVLAAIGFIVHRNKPIAQFWLGVTVIALLLALGEGTPLAQLTYHLPAYNKFRAQGRHFIEMALAVSVLAGLGVAAIHQKLATQRLVWKTLGVSTGVVLVSLASIFIFANQIQAQAIAINIAPPSFVPWKNWTVGIPLVIFGLAIAVLLYLSGSKPSRLSLGLLLFVVLIDLGSFGWFYEWRDYAPKQNSLVPTAAIQKYRETLNQSQQRILPTHAASEVSPNLSRLWGVKSASGYGPLILSRYSQLLAMDGSGGLSGNWAAVADRSLDILSVRYVSVPPVVLSEEVTNASENQGILWATEDMSLSLGSGYSTPESNSIKFKVPSPAKATAIGIVSSLANSTNVPNDAEILRISLKDTAGRVTTKSLRAGRDTAEWAYDCRDVRPYMKHQRAVVFSSYPVKDCQAHSYVSVLPLSSTNPVQEVELKWVGASGVATIGKISLIDKSVGQSYPLAKTARVLFDPSRWRDVANQKQLTSHLYENLRAMPRTWLVPEVVRATSDEILRAIQSSQLPDGRSYEPAQIALVEDPLNFKQQLDAAATAKVISLADTQIEVQTRSRYPAFLVLSDAYYPGWQARIDGVASKIFQTNYVLRGVQLPAGKHVVKFEFKPVSFRLGAGISAAALCLLGYSTFRLWQKQKPFSSS